MRRGVVMWKSVGGIFGILGLRGRSLGKAKGNGFEIWWDWERKCVKYCCLRSSGWKVEIGACADSSFDDFPTGGGMNSFREHFRDKIELWHVNAH